MNQKQIAAQQYWYKRWEEKARKEYRQSLAWAEREHRSKLALHHNLLWRSMLCPLSLLAIGWGELLLICALMRQQFRDEK